MLKRINDPGEINMEYRVDQTLKSFDQGGNKTAEFNAPVSNSQGRTEKLADLFLNRGCC